MSWAFNGQGNLLGVMVLLSSQSVLGQGHFWLELDPNTRAQWWRHPQGEHLDQRHGSQTREMPVGHPDSPLKEWRVGCKENLVPDPQQSLLTFFVEWVIRDPPKVRKIVTNCLCLNKRFFFGSWCPLKEHVGYNCHDGQNYINHPMHSMWFHIRLAPLLKNQGA